MKFVYGCLDCLYTFSHNPPLILPRCPKCGSKRVVRIARFNGSGPESYMTPGQWRNYQRERLLEGRL